MDGDEEAYILLLLSDGNLPTGSFVASAGLESYVTHGFFTPLSTPGYAAVKHNDKLEYTIEYIRDSLQSYARSALPFVSDAHRVVQEAISTPPSTSTDQKIVDVALDNLRALDELYEATTLNHIARRASKTQGVALLSLYTKGFSKPPIYTSASSSPLPEAVEDTVNEKSYSDNLSASIVDGLKLAARREDVPGHLPTCWGVLTAALGLSLERSQFLHLFLYARGILSAGVRLNILGPYAAQQLLLHSVRPIVTDEAAQCAHLRTGLQTKPTTGDVVFDDNVLNTKGPAMTWPLGEIIAARHDLQHSRVFNS